MDADSALAGTALFVFVLLFALICAGEARFYNVRSRKFLDVLTERGSPKSIQEVLGLSGGLAAGLTLIRRATSLGAVMSAVALAFSLANPGWPLAASAAFMTLLFLALLETASRAAAHHLPENVWGAMNLGIGILGRSLEPITRTASRHLGKKKATSPQQDWASGGNGSARGEEVELQETERRMIQGVLSMGESAVREIMVPRVDLTAVEADAQAEQVAKLMQEKGHSRIPIYEENIDNIVGIVHARDLLSHTNLPSPAANLRTLARTPHFIPESMRLDDLLKLFQSNKTTIAIVVDEYGGTAGLVTIEDIVEEIVGEIEDEFHQETAPVEFVADGEALMDGRVSLDDLEEHFAVTVQSEGFDTLGGFVLSRLGKMPQVGDVVEADGLRIEVLSTVGRRIQRLRVSRRP